MEMAKIPSPFASRDRLVEELANKFKCPVSVGFAQREINGENTLVFVVPKDGLPEGLDLSPYTEFEGHPIVFETIGEATAQNQ